ncbi:hypothetical protein ACFVAM_01925 [Streptomyces californicus]|uniref:hypothetical protein n=1 Tax=Streptomyces californicus TaxID=67351 RepID=UPI0036D1B94B
MLVEGLPPDGALARAASKSPWTSTEYQLADIRDLLGRQAVDFRNANRGEKTPQQPYPEPVWRPGDPTPKQKAKAEARKLRKAREGSQQIVDMVLPRKS